MNSKHYRSNPKSKQFKRQKVFKGVKGPPITWEFVEKEKEPVPLTTWQKVVSWFKALPIWSIK